MDNDIETPTQSTMLKEFKKRMHIFHNSEDDNLQRILTASVFAIKRNTGYSDYKINEPEFVELVFERSRYAYNDQLEWFEDNFLSQLLGLQLTSLGGDDIGTTTNV